MAPFNEIWSGSKITNRRALLSQKESRCTSFIIFIITTHSSLFENKSICCCDAFVSLDLCPKSVLHNNVVTGRGLGHTGQQEPPEARESSESKGPVMTGRTNVVVLSSHVIPNMSGQKHHSHCLFFTFDLRCVTAIARQHCCCLWQ